VLGRDPRGGAERDEPEVAPLVPGRAIIEVNVRMADLAVVGSVAVVLGLEVETRIVGSPTRLSLSANMGPFRVEARAG
jgi:hypothetical protein